jgi:hypothetical protein
MHQLDKAWKKLTMQEIDEFWNNDIRMVLDEIVRAYKAGAAFVFGVDKIKYGYRLTINRILRGIYLAPDIEKLEQEKYLYLGGPTAIVPDTARAGTIDWRGEQDVKFYVSHKEFARFCQEAEQIFDEYFLKGFCFRMIPDLWFNDMALIQFIRERLRFHPATMPWFSDPQLPKVTRIEMSAKFNG